MDETSVYLLLMWKAHVALFGDDDEMTMIMMATD